MKKLVVAIIIFLTIVVVIYPSYIKKTTSEDLFNWKAKYIWIFGESNVNPKNKYNTWACFRKKINIDSERDIREINAKIAVDSKYWLYINGEIVVREGGVKRGEKVNSIYYDEVDITKYLTKGENTIAILVWYFGLSSFSHVDSGQGALLFQTKIGEQIIISDDTWKVIKNPAYLKDDPITNLRLSESNIYYDSNLEIEDWYKSTYDDTSWTNASIYGSAGDLPWGEMIPRDIPQFKYSEIKEYENFEQYRNYTTPQDELLVLETPYNTQLTPYLKVEAKPNQKIYISLDENYNKNGKEQRVTYITKDGIQEFESLAWINGEKIYYYIPKGTKVISLGYRQTGYDTELSGKFVSNDNIFNELWTMANRTLYVNMRDSYMDCPDRERALWWADNSIAMEEAMYGLDTNSNCLYEKSVKSLIGWKHDNILMTVIPSISSQMHLPVQMLLGIASMYNYYEYTGNRDFLVYIYPALKEYLNAWSPTENGLVALNNYHCLWVWGDSSYNCDYNTIENSCYYYALSSIYKMAQELEYKEEMAELEERCDKLKEAFNRELWRDNVYADYDKTEGDVRANAIAILSGLADEDKYEIISKLLIENMDNSVFMEKYVLEALCEIGKIEEAQNRIRQRYSIMVENQDYSSTLWEYWEKDAGSKNHTWSGGPLIIMSKYFSGIKPLKPGYSEILVKPNFGNLTNMESTVNTVKGAIYLKTNKSDEEISLELTVPSKTLIAVEKKTDNPLITVNKKTVYEDRTNINKFKVKYSCEDDKYLYFYVEKGKYTIKSK